jgi:hypothetical protein
MAYYSLEPFGEERGDLRAGIIASTIANRHRNPKEEKRAYAPADFAPKFWEDTPQIDLGAKIAGIFDKLGGE